MAAHRGPGSTARWSRLPGIRQAVLFCRRHQRMATSAASSWTPALLGCSRTRTSRGCFPVLSPCGLARSFLILMWTCLTGGRRRAFRPREHPSPWRPFPHYPPCLASPGALRPLASSSPCRKSSSASSALGACHWQALIRAQPTPRAGLPPPRPRVRGWGWGRSHWQNARRWAEAPALGRYSFQRQTQSAHAVHLVPRLAAGE